MLFPKTKKIGLQNHWHRTKNTVFGLYKSYLFTIGDAHILNNPSYKYVVIHLPKNLSVDTLIEIEEQLQANRKPLKFTRFQRLENGLYIQFEERLKLTKLETLTAFLDFAVGVLQKLNIPEASTCQQCANEKPLKPYVLNGNGVQLCDTCANQLGHQIQEVNNQTQYEDKHYLNGFLGALLFSAGGVLLWILIAVFLNYMASAIALVMSFFAIKGYAYFGGKQGKATRWLIILANIIGIVAANVLTVSILLYRAGFDTLMISTLLLQEGEIRKALIDDMAISFFLSLLVWIYLFVNLKHESLSIKPAELINS